MMRAVGVALAGVALADRPADLIEALPGFPPQSSWGFKAYSGILDVPGPVCGYDSLKIHYQFHTSQSDPAKDPVATWHQGGPGGSSINIGLYGEMGAFQIGDAEHGNYINKYAWNTVANMLYLESPAGSGSDAGYSQCITGGKAGPCSWTDTTQAEAYSHTLRYFFSLFPEFAKNDFYLTGESYFGQYGPNIAYYILNTEPFKSSINLKGIAAGNACWGGTETCVACNGPSSDKIDVDLFFGKGLFSPKLKQKIDDTCKFPTEYKTSGSGGDSPFECEADTELSKPCQDLLATMKEQVGPHNVYNIYDDCPNTAKFLQKTGKDMAWLSATLRRSMHNVSATRAALRGMNGGYDWDCGGDVSGWMHEASKSLHLDGVKPGASSFDYNCSGPASITLWPELSKKIRVLIYNGDADACVPYIGNEQWISILEAAGDLEETAPWMPWYVADGQPPAGYLTKYQAPGASVDFSFATIRLAGHMAPTFQPAPSLVMIKSFFKGASEQRELVV